MLFGGVGDGDVGFIPVAHLSGEFDGVAEDRETRAQRIVGVGVAAAVREVEGVDIFLALFPCAAQRNCCPCLIFCRIKIFY